ncbi:unnamed protein product [Clonostachys byssicola]|uniref:Uncharacterized protein n=1 Tax=Clonostachys byssicola TaxID=160290 RepID=A0A9N9UQ68_9HYPO|nr:unnamed protein product [Clonostachys byssicola]
MGTTTLVQCFREQVNLLRLAETMISSLFTPSNNFSGASRKSLRDSSNLALSRWHALLPGFVQWNKWEPTSKPLLPSVAALHVRIVLNSEACRGTYMGGDSENARAMCLSSAQDIISIVRKYRSSYGLKHTPFIFIYGIVQALRTSQAIGIAQESNYLINILEESSATWDLARHIRVNL